MRCLALLAVVLLAMAGHAVASDDVVQTSRIIAEQTQIREAMTAGRDRFADMPQVKRAAITREQDKLFALLEGTTSTADLSPAKKAEVFNAQEAIFAAINNREDERIVCEQVRRTGSHRVTRVCKSLAQIRAEREAARANMENQPRICMGERCLGD